MNALTLPIEYDQRKKVLKDYIDSGLLPKHIRTPEQADVIVGIGREIGLPPIASMRTIILINGTPTVSPAMMLALANRRGLIADMELIKTDTGAKFRVLRQGRKTWHEETFTKADADRLGLSGKDNYKKKPKVMYAWRSVAAGMRVLFSDVIFGLYTPEELGAEIDINAENELDGRIIDASHENVGEGLLKTILERLKIASEGDEERMASFLQLATEHQENGQLVWVSLSDLSDLVDKPKWLEGIIRNMDKMRIGVSDDKLDEKLANIQNEKDDANN